MTFTFLLTGFTFAFMIQFDGQGPFATIWQSIVKVFVMMIEFDYESTFENVEDTDWLSFIGRATFLFFVVLVAIVLMNLMVGVAVSDIAELVTKGRSQRLAKQVSFLSLLEVLVGSDCTLAPMPGTIKNWAKNRRSVLPEVIMKVGKNSLDCGETSLPTYIKESIIEKVDLSRQSKTDSSTISLEDIASRLDKLDRQQNGNVSREIAQLKAVIKSQGVSINKIQEQLNYLVLLSNQQEPQRRTSSDGFSFNTGPFEFPQRS